MHHFFYYAVYKRMYRVYMHVYMRTALFECLISTRTTNMYVYTNYVRAQQLCTRTIILYTYNNYVCIQQLCMQTTMYA